MIGAIVALAAIAACGDDDPPSAATGTPPSSSTSPGSTSIPPTSRASTESTSVEQSTSAPSGSTASSIATTTGQEAQLTAQEITVRDPDGQTHSLTSDETIQVTQRSISFDLEPTAVSTGLAVTVATVEPSEVCTADSATTVFILGTAEVGSTCVVRLLAPGTESFAEADYLLSMSLGSTGNISWTFESGPPQQACFEPGEAVPDLVIRPTPDSDPLEYQVDMIDSYVDLPSGANPELESSITLFLDLGDDGNQPVGRFVIGSAAPPGTTLGFTIGYSAQGTQIYITDEPDQFEWRIEAPCP